jgi:hypothetical protein
MGSLNKSFSLLIILILAASSLIVVKPAFAQSIPKPSVPEFTVKYVDYSYDVPPTYGIDQYSGKSVITQAGYHVDNRTMVFTIKNHPFNSYNDSSGNYITLYYNFRFKGHYGDQWSYCPFYVFHNLKTNQLQVQTTHSYGPYSGGFFTYYSASNSDYTVIPISFYTLTGFDSGTQSIPSGSPVDFQVQAQIGHIDDMPSGLMAGDYYSFTGESSDWSSTQTITVANGATSTSTSPTPLTPEFSSLAIQFSLITMAAIAGLLVYFKKRKF